MMAVLLPVGALGVSDERRITIPRAERTGMTGCVSWDDIDLLTSVMTPMSGLE